MDKGKLSLLLNAVLGIAVVVLFVLHFSDGKVKGPQQDSEQTAIAQQEENKNAKPAEADTLPADLPKLEETAPLQVAYLNLDELQKKYSFFLQGSRAIENKYNRVAKDMEDLKKKYMEEVQAFQQNSATFGEGYKKMKQEEIMKLEQQIQEKQRQIQNEYPKDLEEFNQTYIAKLDKYFDRLSKEKDYDYIFAYGKGQPAYIVYANDSLQITSEVIEGLNKDN